MVDTTTLPELHPGFGGAVLATRGGRPVLRAAAGVADAATGRPPTHESIVEPCSAGARSAAAAPLPPARRPEAFAADRVAGVAR